MLKVAMWMKLIRVGRNVNGHKRFKSRTGLYTCIELNPTSLALTRTLGSEI